VLVDGDQWRFTFVAGGEIGTGGQEQEVSGLQGNAANLAFKGQSSALNTYDNGIVSSPEIRLFEGSAYEVTVVWDDDFEQVVTGIDFELFFDCFEPFWEEVEEFVDLV
jgi:hypothetical protein